MHRDLPTSVSVNIIWHKLELRLISIRMKIRKGELEGGEDGILG